MTNVEKVLEQYGDQIIAKMKQILLTSRKRATGTLINSIGYKIKNNQIDISAVPYSTFVDKGRRAGKMPPIKAILDWVKVKRISIGNNRSKPIVSKGRKQEGENKQSTPEQVAFVIARSIGRKGIKPTPFIKEPMLIFKSKKFKSDLKQAMAEDLKKELKNLR